MGLSNSKDIEDIKENFVRKTDFDKAFGKEKEKIRQFQENLQNTEQQKESELKRYQQTVEKRMQMMETEIKLRQTDTASCRAKLEDEMKVCRVKFEDEKKLRQAEIAACRKEFEFQMILRQKEIEVCRVFLDAQMELSDKRADEIGFITELVKASACSQMTGRFQQKGNNGQASLRDLLDLNRGVQAVEDVNILPIGEDDDY